MSRRNRDPLTDVGGRVGCELNQEFLPVRCAATGAGESTDGGRAYHCLVVSRQRRELRCHAGIGVNRLRERVGGVDPQFRVFVGSERE